MILITIPTPGTIEYGARNGLENALKVAQGERVLVITDRETQGIGTAWYEQAVDLTGKSSLVQMLVLEDLFGPRPIEYSSMPDALQQAIGAADVVVYAAGGKEKELPLRQAIVEASAHARYGHAVHVNETIMLTGMQSDIEACNRRCAELYKRLQGVEWVRITCPAGTDIKIYFDPEMTWVNSDNNFSPGHWHNLPSGEVFGAPKTADGKYVVCGVLGDHFAEKYGSLADTPVTFYVVDGRINSVECPGNRALEDELVAYLNQPDAQGIPGGGNLMLGELGVGALELAAFVYNMLQDEKMLGTVHIASGDNYAKRCNVPPNYATTHCDAMIISPTVVTSTGDTILLDGVYQPPT